MALAKFEDVKAWLGITDTSQDAILKMIQSSVEALIYEYAETDFDTHKVVNEVLDAQRSDIIIVDNYPLITVEGVRIGTFVDGSGGIPLDTVSDIIVRPHEIALRSAYTVKGRGYVAVDYTWGFKEVPEQVRMATILGCEAFYRRKNRSTIGIRSRGKEGESESYTGAWDQASGLPVEVTAMIQPFKYMEFPVSAMAVRNQ